MKYKRQESILPVFSCIFPLSGSQLVTPTEIILVVLYYSFTFDGLIHQTTHTRLYMCKDFTSRLESAKINF